MWDEYKHVSAVLMDFVMYNYYKTTLVIHASEETTTYITLP